MRTIDVFFVGHEACPACQKQGKDNHGDNLARYSDGSATCFSCRYWEPRKGGGDLYGKKEKPTNLYQNLVSELAPANLLWLRQYLDMGEISRYFKFDPETSRHVLTLGDFKEGRSVNGAQPKTLSIGEKPLYIFGADAYSSGLVLVEDPVSAIKVSRVMPAMALFGSSMSDTLLKFVLGQYNVERVYIWLDPDKREAAIAMAKVFHRKAFEAKAILTRDDPKVYSEHEIKRYLLEYTNAHDLPV